MPVVKAARGKMVNHVKSLCVSTRKGNIHLTPGYWPKTLSRPRLASEEGRQGELTKTQKKGKEDIRDQLLRVTTTHKALGTVGGRITCSTPSTCSCGRSFRVSWPSG